MRWIIPHNRQDQDICTNQEPASSSEFNTTLAENDGGVAVAEPPCKATAPGQHDADADIRSGRVRRFDDAEDMIASLKRPWQD